MLILHGENTTASRDFFLTLKNQSLGRHQQVLNLAGSKLSLDLLSQAVESTSLFGQANAVFIEDFFASPASAAKEKIHSFLLSHTSSEIFVWEGKDVTTHLKKFSPALVKKFDLPKHIFQYLDTLSLPALKQSLEHTAPELVLSLLVGHIHKLILTLDGAGEIPDWQRRKLASQSARFTLPLLIQLNHQLLDIDYAQKTSSAPFSLAAALELWTAGLVVNGK